MRTYTKQGPHNKGHDYFFFGFESTQLARQVQQERAQVEVLVRASTTSLTCSQSPKPSLMRELIQNMMGYCPKRGLQMPRMNTSSTCAQNFLSFFKHKCRILFYSVYQMHTARTYYIRNAYRWRCSNAVAPKRQGAPLLTSISQFLDKH